MPLSRQYHSPRWPARQAGFTLIELLTVIAIVGLLSTMGMVSYESARMTSRDVKRTADMRQLNTALELYFQNNGAYPADLTPGPGGLILGEGEITMLTDAGFSDFQRGQLYMQRLPKNPPPTGLPYTYRGLNLDGTDCNADQCDSYAIIFFLEKAYGQLEPGPHAATPLGIAGPEAGMVAGALDASGQVAGLASLQGQMSLAADQITNELVQFVDSKTVQDTATVGVAPAAATAAAVNTAMAVNTVAGGAAAGQYFLFFLTQPFLLVQRRRRKHWGTIYNTLSHLPVDLVIVRLRDLVTNRIIRSEVTDRDGRFTFLVPQGRYQLEAVKNGFVFPSSLITDELATDGPFQDLYRGQPIEVGPEGGSLNYNIPMDPITADQQVSDLKLIEDSQRRKWGGRIAILSPLLGAGSLAISPSWLTAALFVLQVLIYAFFRRISTSGDSRNWGVVYDQQSNKPVYQAVVRIFALPYHKLLEAKVTDHLGRYNFKVGSNEYYMTVTKKRYQKTETEPIDFSDARKPMFIAADLPLRPENYVVAVKPTERQGADQPAREPAATDAAAAAEPAATDAAAPTEPAPTEPAAGAVTTPDPETDPTDKAEPAA
jgi:prepilin-type N-terminal cleavage/methylation domain-containing protein